MDNKQQLPERLATEIYESAHKTYGRKTLMVRAHIDAATPFAALWHQAEVEKKLLRDVLADLLSWHTEMLTSGLIYRTRAAQKALDQLFSEEKGKTDSNEDGLYVTQRKRQLAEKIDARLIELGLTRKEFAEQMGTVPSSITKWLSGQHNFEINTLFEIERVLGFTLFK